MDTRSDHTLVGVYETQAEADDARQDLLSSGFSESQITLNPQATGARTAETGEESFWDKVKDFFNPGEQDIYEEASRRGHALLSINVAEGDVDRAADILGRHNPINVAEKEAQWRKAGWAGGRQTEEAGEQKIPVVEEQMKVGKRAKERGGVRVFRRVTETPVQEDVRLREEHVYVDREKVDRPAHEADFREQTVEASETREEPVVSKEARVIEEVTIGKDVQERTETVKGTVRRADVEIEELDQDFHRDFETRYADRGYQYAHSREAYRFGQTLASHPDYRDRGWKEVEPEARDLFEQKNPGRWHEFKDAVRYGYERTRQHKAA